MIRTLFRYFILPLLLFLLARSFLRSFLASLRSGRSNGGVVPGAPELQAGGDLKRDPVCGTYVSGAVSVKRTVKGIVVHFCSNECRDKYGA
jgi:hypothetical protein